MLATRDGRQEIAVWLRRHGHEAGPIRATLEAVRDQGGIVSLDGHPGRSLDWAALAATAEAIEGACLVRRNDRMVSSLAPGDPLHVQLGVCGGPLLGIAATTVEPDLPAALLIESLGQSRATIWLARTIQVRAIAALPSPSMGRLPEVIVIPIGDHGDLDAARHAAEAFAQAHAREPVVAFAPGAVGGVVSMNAPSSRFDSDFEVAGRPESLGRVVMGVVVWPQASARDRLRLAPTGDDASMADSTLVVAATGARQTTSALSGDPTAPPSFGLPPGYLVDDQGFLFPPGASVASGEGKRGLDGGESGRLKSNLG